MFCDGIEIENFRNIEKADVSFCQGTNILLGDNAQGKTNMLEAIYLTALGKSFRQATDREIIRFGEEYSRIKNRYFDNIRKNEISVTLFSDRKQKKIEHNRVRVAKTSEIVGRFKVVLFCPEHLAIIKEGPSLRRNFLDVAISQLKPLYIKSLQRYVSILKERNSLIKQAAENPENFNRTIDLWSAQLADEAANITLYRVEYLKMARHYVEDCFCDMTGEKEKPSLVYQSSCHLSEDECLDRGRCRDAYLELYNTRHDREIGAETTLWGIHRDDIDMSLNGKNARIFCSQGQQRSFALAMKLAEGEIIKNEFGGDYPVFLLDDVLSELDAARRTYLDENIKNKQVIMTCCEQSVPDAGKIIKVKNGKFEESE